MEKDQPLRESTESQANLEAAQLLRVLRHEVGDFLQLVYSTVSLLDKRLPADDELHRPLVANLRSRAVACKTVLEMASDLVAAVTLQCEAVDVPALTRSVLATLVLRYPDLTLRAESTGAVARCWADRERLVRSLQLLAEHGCAMARREVTLCTKSCPQERIVKWTVRNDGPGLAETDLETIFHSFTTARSSRLPFGLAPARRILLLHGGMVSAANLPGGGFETTAVLPVAAKADPDPHQSSRIP